MMLLKTLTVAGLLFCTAAAFSQTLFTYGKYAVGRDEFLKAYNRNNSDSVSGRIPIDEYLHLYAKFRMKVQSALDARMDTSSSQREELQAFRLQLADGFLKEDASMKLMVDEAARRSLKDICLSQIFIPAPSGSTIEDMNAAEARINEIYSRLKKGESFAKLAAEAGSGNIGWVTVFVLPYDIENLVYATPVGKYTLPYQSRAGFHIFLNKAERKAVGKVRVAQILLSYPPGDADPEISKKKLAERADSVAQALKNGASFSALATALSGDNLSYQTGGQLPVFGVGHYDTLFEKEAFGLKNDSDISQPFATRFGYHILKRMQRIPVVEDTLNKNWREVIRERVQLSDRMQVAKIILIKNIRETIRRDAGPKVIASDTATLNYYRNHLEKYNADFAAQLKEFREGNLLFAIMQKKVWGQASADSMALLKYYMEHPGKYWWENSADALLITCANETVLKDAQEFVQSGYKEWKKWNDQSNGLIQVDSGRFELSQIPVQGKTNFTEGLSTAPVTNAQDESRSFAYIITLHPQKESRKFEDAKGAVISDYQNALEEKWVAELKKRYPLKINTAVLQHLKN